MRKVQNHAGLLTWSHSRAQKEHKLTKYAKGTQNMATRARKVIAPTRSSRTTLAGWRELMRQSIIRSGALIAAAALALFALFYALSVLSYSPADAAFNSAAEGVRHNWMGKAGAYVGDGALFAFGLPAILLLPLMLIFAQRLFKNLPQTRWRGQIITCVIGMLLIGFGMAYWQSGSDIGLPGGWGGAVALLLEKCVIFAVSMAGEGWQSTLRWLLILLSLIGGAALVIRSLELEEPLLRMPAIPLPSGRLKMGGEKRASVIDDADDGTHATPAAPRRIVERENRKPPEITERKLSAKPANFSTGARQGDFLEAMPCRRLICSIRRRRKAHRNWIRRRWRPMPGCWKPCWRNIASKAKSSRCALAPWSPCMNWSQPPGSRPAG